VKVTPQLTGLDSQTLNPAIRLAIVLALFILYILAFIILYPYYAHLIGTVSFGAFVALPVFATAYLLGIKGGLVAWISSFPLLFGLMTWCGAAPLPVMTQQGGFIGLGLLLIAVIPIGYIHHFSQNMKRESAARKKAEAALYDSQQFVQQVMHSIPDIVYIYDLEKDTNIYVNHAITSVLGYTPEAIEAMGPAVDATILHPDDVASTVPAIRERLHAAKDGQVIESEYRVKHVDGQWHWFSVQEVVFARYADGRMRQFLGIAQDITERKIARESTLEKERLQVALEKQRELSVLKNRLMLTLSHEFRTPLSIILASGELLERYFDRLTPTRRAESLMTIKTQIMHLREMLDDIATLVAEGDFSPNFNPMLMNLEQFCRQMVEEFQASIGAAYTVHFTCEGNLDAVLGDGNLLRPILKNLLSNAIKYSHKGGEVYVSLLRKGEEIQLVVRDEGIGIPSDDQSSIFDTFHRASNALNVGGLGLGLRIVRDYVKLHGGTIDLHSEEGKGTTVTIRLPDKASSVTAT
jgi:PAS domain S-box-containing protein